MIRRITTLLSVFTMVIVLTACGGNAIEDQGLDIETKLIAEVEYSGMGDEELPFVYGEILDVMENSDAQYFYIEWGNNDYDWPEGPLKVFQTDKETLDKIAEEGTSISKGSKQITSELPDYFGQDCEEITAGKQQGQTYYNCWYTGPKFTSDTDMMSVYDYYKESGLVLSTGEWNATKVAIHKQMEGLLQYLFVCEGDITTVNKSKDDFNLFPNNGKSEHAIVKCSISGTNGGKDLSLENIYID